MTRLFPIKIFSLMESDQPSIRFAVGTWRKFEEKIRNPNWSCVDCAIPWDIDSDFIGATFPERLILFFPGAGRSYS